jgi:hypothetical protein
MLFVFEAEEIGICSVCSPCYESHVGRFGDACAHVMLSRR